MLNSIERNKTKNKDDIISNNLKKKNPYKYNHSSVTHPSIRMHLDRNISETTRTPQTRTVGHMHASACRHACTFAYAGDCVRVCGHAKTRSRVPCNHFNIIVVCGHIKHTPHRIKIGTRASAPGSWRLESAGAAGKAGRTRQSWRMFTHAGTTPSCVSMCARLCASARTINNSGIIILSTRDAGANVCAWTKRLV